MIGAGEIALKSAWGAGFRDSRPPSERPLHRESTESQRTIDDGVIRLAVSEARTRREIGRLAARFLAVSGHNRLGFSRIGDYCTERLGISGRELQSFAFVASKLEERPSLARAFACGEISWSQTRLLCAIAAADSEVDWLNRARGLTVRDLAREIRGFTCGLARGDISATLDDECDLTEGEARVRFSIPCPARLAFLWRRGIELARRMLGSHASPWQAAEAIVAENCSAVPIEADAPDSVPEEISNARPGRPRSVEPRDTETALAAIESLDAFGLDREMRAGVAALHSIDVELGAQLWRLVDLRIYRSLGFSSFDAYARERVGISPAKARALVMVERKVRDTPELARAYRSGALSWARTLAILPVAEGTFASAWIARAQEVMVRRLHDQVEWALDMRDACERPATPPEVGTALERPDLQTCARPEREVADHRVTFFGPASVVALFRAGVAARTERGEPQWRGFERLLRHAIAEWEALPRHHDPIFARDGWRCCVPGCTARRSLEDHHIVFRSRGGGNEQWNRLAACNWHHHQGIHGYVVRASGRAPDDVTWELGLRSGQAPLMRLHGERYLPVL